MGWFSAIVLIGILLFFILGLAGSGKAKDQKEQIKKKLINAGNLNDSKFLLNPDLNKKITLDTNQKRVIIHSLNIDGNIESVEVDFKNIIKSEIVVDENVVTSFSRGGQLAGSLIGGIAAGGIGAVIGGLTSNKQSTKRIKKIDLKLLIENFQNPIITFDFLQGRTDVGLENTSGFKDTDEKVVNAIRNAEEWQALMEIAIKKVAH